MCFRRLWMGGLHRTGQTSAETGTGCSWEAAFPIGHFTAPYFTNFSISGFWRSICSGAVTSCIFSSVLLLHVCFHMIHRWTSRASVSSPLKFLKMQGGILIMRNASNNSILWSQPYIIATIVTLISVQHVFSCWILMLTFMYFKAQFQLRIKNNR